MLDEGGNSEQNMTKNDQDRKVFVDKRDSQLKWNGWGYSCNSFIVNNRGIAEFRGNRYEMGGHSFPFLVDWMGKTLNMKISHKDFGRDELNIDLIPQPIKNDRFLELLTQRNIKFSLDAKQRAHRSHGHTIEDMVHLRLGECPERIPDIVVWPQSHDDVVNIVETANDTNVVIIPIGGGTSVSGALKCPNGERRCIVSLDMGQMNKILWLDDKNLIARAQCGIIGADLEQQLNDKGFTLGHEPDSIEFSSLGGWVATRASGIKKNKYGNIEDLLVHVTLVTPTGVIQKSCVVPRVSSGPDIHHFIMGSEGTLGVITEVTFKICYLPECKKFGSILFPSFEHGVHALREMAKQKIFPASIRLLDNAQFKFGQALKPEHSIFGKLTEALKRFYVTKWKKFDPDTMAPATLLLEGAKEEVEMQERRIYAIASKYGGIAGGSENGRYGYMLTFVIAYLRDMGLDYLAVGESFETSVPWDKVLLLCRNVKELCARETVRRGVKFPAFISCRVTQLYDAGACVYFYFGFNYRDMKTDSADNADPRKLIEKALHVYEEIEIAARNEILNCGGSISHHHGVGKLRQRWLPQTIGDVGLNALKAIKERLDPNNIFACGNLFTVDAKL